MANHPPEIDAATGRSTTGHEWDGIKELNSPLPKWWLYVFYATIVWSIGYWIVYPAWPLVTGYTKGLFGYSSRESVVVELDALKALRASRSTALASASLEDIQRNPDLLTFALAQGKAAFGDNCAPCHGLSATGARGFPNLRDDTWLWGGSLAEIRQTIAHGVRTGDDRSRQGSMPALGGPNGVLKRDEVITVANYVRSLAGLSVRQGTDLAKGKELFETNCVACHGADGRGNRELGAANLTSANWVYGSDEATIVETINNGRGGVMPGWTGRLDDTTVKALTIYVHALGGGQ
ncbi:MAG: cytochrome-c oxidase, cbb3-type subunit III [Phreatobacter sp.]|uniref:cytochrome-c oxidase, cbb3-type subunit III n=1 Tax=Phreatobacter sp. TaxID=1966341 RepID=UPI001A4F9868|nr:cytochrome-c oxidase, cbb3-type subunit III [Phreatobacter sp.]MBL8569824.1 cytochrome-c oxidase, cbb3-type subunit III [Phreatobacter sp.]MCA0319438.1 cytochrome-c oxidase, cbb3-type subunit III [Pseudomonadota bacterium]